MKPVHDVVGYSVPSQQILKDARLLPSLCNTLPIPMLERAAKGLTVACMNCPDMTDEVQKIVSLALRLASIKIGQALN